MALDPIVVAGSPDTLKAAGNKINLNKEYLDGKLNTESANRVASADNSIRLDKNTTVSYPEMYGATHVDSTTTPTPNFNSGSPNFYFDNVGTITIANPTNIQSGKIQEGFIVTKTLNITWGSYYKISDDTLPTSEYYWFSYYVIEDTSIALVFVEGTEVP